jgi:hypothetical protein
VESTYVGPSQQAGEAWKVALGDQDDALLAQLAEQEPPGVALFEIATYVNGLYRGTQIGTYVNDLLQDGTDASGASRTRLPNDTYAMVARVLPTVRAIRHRLGWRQRDVDIGLMRWMRRSSDLSMVIGAGVTKAAHGPSWSELVRRLLEIALDKGHEITEMVPASDSASEPPVRFLPDGSVHLSETSGTFRLERRVVRVERFKPDDEAEARNILTLIKEQGASTDTETLMRGAQLCYDLFAQELFTHITQIIYSRAPQPGPTHRAIAELAHGQSVPSSGTTIRSGWDSIISYNFDALMSEALSEQQVPHTAWAMAAEQPAGDPDYLARNSDWHQPVLHLHGYTPRRLFRITDTKFVFSTAQYLDTYRNQRRGLIGLALDLYLANPVHYALYVGCSFSDEAMNGLLRQAAQRYPGRVHYALLKWPGERRRQDPTIEEIEEYSEQYLDIGVQPVWVYEFSEIPEIIRSLK